jgi:hypothetical protein
VNVSLASPRSTLARRLLLLSATAVCLAGPAQAVSTVQLAVNVDNIADQTTGRATTDYVMTEKRFTAGFDDLSEVTVLDELGTPAGQISLKAFLLFVLKPEGGGSISDPFVAAVLGWDEDPLAMLDLVLELPPDSPPASINFQFVGPIAPIGESTIRTFFTGNVSDANGDGEVAFGGSARSVVGGASGSVNANLPVMSGERDFSVEQQAVLFPDLSASGELGPSMMLDVTLLIGGGERVEVSAGMLIEPVPEPGTGGLVSLGLIALATVRRRC